MVLHKILYFSKVGKLGEKSEGDGGGMGWGLQVLASTRKQHLKPMASSSS